MRSSQTSLAIIVLLAALALATVLALPRGMGAATASAPAAPASAPLIEPAAPTAAKYNVVGMPLDATQQFASQGLGFNSDGLADFVGSSVTQVLRWNTARQEFDSWDPVYNEGVVNGVYTTTPFALAVGGSYWLLVNATAPTVVSFVGDVPAAGSVKFTLKGTSPTCSYNAITIPLEQSSLTNSDLLADSISTTQVSQVLRWNAARQEFDTWDPVYNEGVVDGVYTTTPFSTRIGYPYWVCLLAGVNGNVWP